MVVREGERGAWVEMSEGPTEHRIGSGSKVRLFWIACQIVVARCSNVEDSWMTTVFRRRRSSRALLEFERNASRLRHLGTLSVNSSEGDHGATRWQEMGNVARQLLLCEKYL